MKRWRRLCPTPKHSLLPIVACAPPRAERGNVARSCLHFVGYVTPIAYLTKKPTEHRLRGEVSPLKYNEFREGSEPGFLQAGGAGARRPAARAFEASGQRGDRGRRLARLLDAAGGRGGGRDPLRTV